MLKSKENELLRQHGYFKRIYRRDLNWNENRNLILKIKTFERTEIIFSQVIKNVNIE